MLKDEIESESKNGKTVFNSFLSSFLLCDWNSEEEEKNTVHILSHTECLALTKLVVY